MRRPFIFCLLSASRGAAAVLLDRRSACRHQRRFWQTLPPDAHVVAPRTAAAGENMPRLYADEANSLTLSGGEPLAFVTDSGRAPSSSTFSSYDPSLLAEDAMTRSPAGRLAEAQQMTAGDELQPTLAAIAADAVAAAATVTAAVDNSTVEAPPAVSRQPPAVLQHQYRRADPTPASRRVSVRGGGDAAEGGAGSGEQQTAIDEGRQPDAGREDEEQEGEKHAHEERVKAAAPSTHASEGEVRVFVRDHMRNTVSVGRLRAFAELEGRLPWWLLHGIQQSGFVIPTVVQSVAIPLFMQRRDVVGIAPTGSGKTVAFALPALAALAALPSPSHSGCGASNNNHGGGVEDAVTVNPRVLVLCPTRELVQQTRSVFSHLAGNAVRVKGAFGGQDREQQLEFLRRWGGCDVLLSTPGRLCDFVEAGAVSLGQVDFLIMDEADRMLELGFAPQLEFIMSSIRKFKRPRQTTMWTATWNAIVGGLAARFLRPERVLLEVDREHKLNTDITQQLYALQDPSQRIHAVVRLYQEAVISKRQQVLIFVNRKEEVEKIAEDLTTALRAPPELVRCLHGGMKQRRRESIIHGFREGSIRILCATDVAARGLDVPELDHVINYDLPGDADAYVHRVGRTGRAGRRGTAHTFIIAGDSRAPLIARFIAKQQGTALPDEVLAIIRDVELHGGVAAGRQKYKSHARVAGKDWRGSGGAASTMAEGSRYVRGVGHVTTLRRPTPRKQS
ncbi:putative ATP-dependent DEAD/H RNA helicase [Trypanosoma conorhini]|uniref:RNA helicase n=1 Tax=Trypanosoma conorhini TaxID=83891 RepID=A0A3R7RXQ8_9TRYP|nr:putative ATP-dependent DEAD/H RNA helicase [Trypanosoma conorhini]RNF15355.1 putative ATP-dependent DEAD/H RNA helicase [Trypanosoma conorhini]